MKLTIVGYGYVGKAFESILSKHYEIEIVDPKYTNNKIKKDSDAVIVCVSTPQGIGGVCDMRNVYEVVRACPDVPILIKSTVSLEGWRHCKKTYEKRMAFSPEFLREKTSFEDVKNCEHVLIGGDEIPFWTKVFQQIYSAPYIEVFEPEELILGKYFRNSFLALKVSFFNQVYDLCTASGIDYDQVRRAITGDPRIGKSHSLVTKERGFGGNCFTKDIHAIYASALYFSTKLSIIEETIKYNNTIRNENNKK
tara:strand:- start:36 stop:791 length:756 start_codon:yes stop_codon:yes gene_type:complete